MALSDHQRGFLESGMSDRSVASMLGWSLAKVAREREAIRDALIARERLDEIAADPSKLVQGLDLERQLGALEAVPPRVVRWVRFFLNAGWPLKGVAALFDRDPLDLESALRG